MKVKVVLAGALAVAVLVVLPASPALAGAVTRHARRPPTTVIQLRLRGSHGYRLELSEIVGHGVFFTATRRRGRIGEDGVAYVTRHSRVDHTKQRLVNVRIGRFGHFRGHLSVKSTKAEKLERRCDGEPTVVESGVFVGSFRFRGEEDFTQARATRARGSITRTPKQVCSYSIPKHLPVGGKSRGRGAGLPEGEFKLVASDVDRIYFEAEHREEAQIEAGFENVDFQASVAERVGALTVSHYAFVSSFDRGLDSLFQVPNPADQLSEAVLTPPAPFSGSATFQSDGARSGTWTGDLAVRLPGLPTTPLTGGGIKAGLCAGRAGCTRTLPSVLQPVLEAPPGVAVAVAVKR